MTKINDRTMLRISGILEIFMGLITIGFLMWVSSRGDARQSYELWLLVAMYAQAGLEIIAGIAGGLCSHNRKRCRLCIFIGYALMIVSIVNFIGNDASIPFAILQLLSLLILMLYFYGAQKNQDAVKQL